MIQNYRLSIFVARSILTAPFCETDLPIHPFAQETQLAANVMQAYLQQRIVVGLEPLVGIPMHTFELAAVAIQDASPATHIRIQPEL